MNGKLKATYVRPTEKRKTRFGRGRNGTLRCVRKLTTIPTENAIALCVRRRCVTAGSKRRGVPCTRTAPTLNPNMATEIDMNEKWCHIVTLKIRVRSTSYISVASVSRNSPP
jgi:hypothetical protein